MTLGTQCPLRWTKILRTQSSTLKSSQSTVQKGRQFLPLPEPSSGQTGTRNQGAKCQSLSFPISSLVPDSLQTTMESGRGHFTNHISVRVPLHNHQHMQDTPRSPQQPPRPLG